MCIERPIYHTFCGCTTYDTLRCSAHPFPPSPDYPLGRSVSRISGQRAQSSLRKVSLTHNTSSLNSRPHIDRTGTNGDGNAPRVFVGPELSYCHEYECWELVTDAYPCDKCMPAGGLGSLVHKMKIPRALENGDWIEEEIEAEEKPTVEKKACWQFWRW